MPDIAALIQTHGSNPWAYLPLAVLLGALHALEPGHSKSMMAAFVVATRGTAGQAAFETMVDMVLDHLALGRDQRGLDRLQLLGDGDAVAPLLHHGDDGAQVPLGAAQPGEKGGVKSMGHGLLHIPPGGI